MSVRLDDGEDSLDVVQEINVTPFVDVMLVLLIIFMIAAPLATVATVTNQPIFLAIKSDLTLWLGDAPVSSTVLRAALDGISKGDRTPSACSCAPTSLCLMGI